MPLELPNLDDRTYDDLLAEAISLIPNYAPEWTNHNPSDPGIMLIELFAYLTEMLLYRLDRITDRNVISFLKLLNGPTWQKNKEKELGASWAENLDLRTEVRLAVSELRKRYRAVNCEDFELLALQADNRVARTYCVPRRDLSRNNSERAGHISVMVAPKTDYESQIEEIIKKVRDELEIRKLLGTYLHVLAARYLSVSITVTIAPLSDQTGEEIRLRIEEAAQRFLQPLGKDSETVWPFGRNIFVSEIYELIDRVPGVDYVESVDVQPEFPSRKLVTTDEDGNDIFFGVEVKPYELVALEEIHVNWPN